MLNVVQLLFFYKDDEYAKKLKFKKLSQYVESNPLKTTMMQKHQTEALQTNGCNPSSVASYEWGKSCQ